MDKETYCNIPVWHGSTHIEPSESVHPFKDNILVALHKDKTTTINLL